MSVTFSCPAVRASVNAQDSAGRWSHLGTSDTGPVRIPTGARSWLVSAHGPDDLGLEALVAACNEARAPGLIVDCGRLSRDGLAAVRRLWRLPRFGLRAIRSFAAGGVRDPYLTSRELGYLYGLDALERLSLEGGRLRIGAVVKLARRMPRLGALTLSGCFTSDAGIERLGELAGLRELTIHGPSEYGEHPDWLGDRGLAAIARQTRLEVLDLWRCSAITDAGVGALAGHPSLCELTLGDPDHGGGPGAAVLTLLPTLPALRRVALHGCGRSWTLEAVRALEPLPLEALRTDACHLAPEVAAWLRARFPAPAA